MIRGMVPETLSELGLDSLKIILGATLVQDRFLSLWAFPYQL